MLDFSIDTSGTPQDVQRRQKMADALLHADSEGLRTGFRRKPDSVPMIADSR